MASPIDTNAIVSGANTQRIDDVNAQGSSFDNIPNDDQNRQWFLSENTGSRKPISIANNAINNINASMGVDGIANRILNHIGA